VTGLAAAFCTRGEAVVLGRVDPSPEGLAALEQAREDVMLMMPEVGGEATICWRVVLVLS
jgi:hypothetical protein